jgi:hypothetical protein
MRPSRRRDPAVLHNRKQFMRTGVSAALLAAIAFACAASPAVAASQDSVSGNVETRGTVVLPLSVHWQIAATSGPSGAAPTGTVTAASFLNGSVTCLSVEGNVAQMTVRDPQYPGALVAVRVTDNAGLGQPDIVQSNFATVSVPDCSIPEPAYIRNERVVVGDIVVVDAQPLPTSKDQCKNGGWRDFGETFKNQGQCVAFVQRGPKP